MRRLIWLVALTLTIVPAYAQDDGDAGFGGFGFESDLSSEDPFAGDMGGQAYAPKVDPLVDLRSWLSRSGAPAMDKKQEKTLKKLYDKEIKAIAKAFQQRHGISLDSALAAQNAPRGRRGGRLSPEISTEIRNLTDRLMDKIIASLRLDQQGALRTYQSDQLREQRQERFVQSMDLAGLTLTPDQESEVEALYSRESRLRTLIIVEAKGEPYKVQVSRLEAQTTQKVMELMNPTQKTAIAGVGAKATVSPLESHSSELESLP